MTRLNHGARIGTAVVLLALVAGGLAMRGPLELGLVAAICLVAQWEFSALFVPSREAVAYKLAGLGLGYLVLYAAWAAKPELGLIALLAGFWLAALSFLFLYGTGRKAAMQAAFPVMVGLLYIPLSLQLFFSMSTAEAAMALLATFTTDTGAYYAGSLWGKRKIWPRVSPKKTWIGSVGGFVPCVAATLAMGLLFGDAPWPAWLLLGAALNLAAQCGDFFESALKRSMEVKDSGMLLPGHGGLLDRVDGLLLVLPVYAGLRELFTFFPG